MKKFAALAIAAAMLVAAPAGANLTGAGRAAPVSSDFATIGGPKRLQPRSKLRVPIRCSVNCDTTVFTKLRTPNDEIGPDKATGHLVAGQARRLVVTFNDAATQDIQDHFKQARLRVGLWAVDSGSGDRAHVVKVFKFHRP